MEKLLTAQELAKVLSLSVDTIWRYTRQKKIPVVELGEKQYRYEKEAVLAALSVGALPAKEACAASEGQNSPAFGDCRKILGETGFCYEIIEGTLVKEPLPPVRHLRVSRELGRQLMDFFNEFDPGSELFFAPLEITLGNNVLKPDLLFFSNSRKNILCKEHIDEACDLVVEIVPITGRRKSRVQKMEIYRKAGVPHFWLVDSEENILETFFLKNDRYTLVFVGGPGDHFIHPEFPGLELDLDRIFYRPIY